MLKFRFLFLLVLLPFYAISGTLSPKDELYFYPELTSSSWSPDLSYEDIRNIRVGISEISSEYGDHGYALGLLAPYIKDKRNIEARFYYAFGLTRSLFGGNADKAKEMLLELVNEGWPLAIEALREQACEAEKLKLRCERLGYRESERLVYLEWARKDPLHVWMYSKATRSSIYLKNPEEELSAEEYEYLLYGKGVKGIGNYETIKILNEGIKKGCTACSIRLYNSYFFKVLRDVEKGIEVSEEYINKLKELAGITKILLLSGQDYSSTMVRQLFSYDNENNEYNVKINKINKIFDMPTYTEDDIFELVNIHAEKGAANFFLNINFMRNETFENQLLKSLSKNKIKAHGKRGINRVEEPNPTYKEFKRINQDRGWIRRLSHIYIDWKMHEKWKKDQQEAGLDSNMFGSLESN